MRRHAEKPFQLRGQKFRLDYATSKPSYEVAAPREAEPSRTLYIGNVPPTATAQELGKLLEPLAPIKRLRIDGTHEGSPRAFAHVEVESLEDAQALVEKTRTEPLQLESRTLWVAYARTVSGGDRAVPNADPTKVNPTVGFRRRNPPSASLWVGALPREATEEDLVKLFAHVAEPTAVRLSKPKDGRPKGCAHVDFSTQEEAIRVMENNTKKAYRLWDRAELLLDYATPLVKPQFPPHYTLFAPGVEGEEEDVRALFKDHEKNIRKVVLRQRQFGDANTRAAFIEFNSVEEATAAKDELNGKKIKGQVLTLLYGKRSSGTSPKLFPVWRPDDFGIKKGGRGRNES